MTPIEQAAFVKAYGSNVQQGVGQQDVAHHSDEVVANFVARYEAGENIDYSFEQTSIMDALGVWHEAIKFALERRQHEKI